MKSTEKAILGPDALSVPGDLPWLRSSRTRLLITLASGTGSYGTFRQAISRYLKTVESTVLACKKQHLFQA